MPDIDFNELQNIKSLETELIKWQEYEFFLEGDRNKIQGTIDSFAGKLSLYADPKKLKLMRDQLKLIITTYMKQAGNQGRILGKKGLNTYLTKAEREAKASSEIRRIRQATISTAEKRLKIAYAELDKNINILRADIDLFKKRARVAGLTTKDIYEQLVLAGKAKEGLAQGFAKRLKSITVQATRRERAATEIDKYKEVAKRGEEWIWITISTKPCGDCKARAGLSLPLPIFRTKWGFPGSGKTICGAWCRCKLVPQSIANKQFKTIREFKWSKNDLVLTPVTHARHFDKNKK